MAHIELKNIHKTYGNKVLFSNFNLTIEKGDFWGIKGGSGKGKSTLLNIIGLLEECDGEVLIDNKPVNCKNKRDVRKYLDKEIGYLFQNYALIDDLTVFDNLKIVMQKESRHKMAGKMKASLAEVGLPESILGNKIFQLSGGEQQRVALARLMLKECNIILADEPTGSLDSANSKIVMDILKRFNDAGKTIIMVTHNDSVLSYCDMVLEI